MFSISTLATTVAALALSVKNVQGQVTATGTMGVTNPTAAALGSAINQTSYARLLSVNSIDDFCLFAPPVAGDTIGDTEAEQVAWCVQARNDARVIPDGVLQAVHFVKTPLYIQVQGYGDFTKINILDGDEGGELDPHGATGLGNPVGGNVTSNITGSDVSYQEWMNYMSYSEFCIRVCVSENATYSAALECQHTLDEMGCEWVMPGDYTNNTFTTCDADSAYPPGLYPETNGSTFTFEQRYTGVYTDAAGSTEHWTQGYTTTPQTAYSTPASSNCVSQATVSNGISSLALTNVAFITGATDAVSTGSATVTMSSSAATSSATGASSAASSAASSGASSGSSMASSASKSGSGVVASATSKAVSAATSAVSSAAASSAFVHSEVYGPLVMVGVSAFAVVAGAGAFFL